MRGGIAFVLLLAACDCPKGQTRCLIGPPPGNAVCIDLSSDPFNCGGCNHHCTGGYACKSGQCVPCTATCGPNEVLDKITCKCTCPTRSCGAGSCCAANEGACCGSQCCSDARHCSLEGCCRSLVCNNRCCGDLSLSRCCGDGSCPNGGSCYECLDPFYYLCSHGQFCCPFGQDCCGSGCCAGTCLNGACLPGGGSPVPPAAGRPARKAGAPVR